MTIRRGKGTGSLTLTLIIFFFFTLAPLAWCQGPQVNLKYIDSRMKQHKLPGGKVITIWKTADPALEKQGIAASTVETALLTRAYIIHYKIFQKPESLKKAVKGLEFLYYMQAENGCMYPYLLSETDGDPRTGTPDLSEPTAHSFITVTEGINAFKGGLTSDFRNLENCFLKVTGRLNKWMENPEHSYGNYVTFQKMQIPAWLIEGRGDLSAMYLYGLARFAQKLPYGGVEKTAEKLAEGIIKFRFTQANEFPQNAHLSFTSHPGLWKTENSLQGAALALAGRAFNREAWISDGRRDIIGFLVHLTASYGPIDGFYPHPDIYPQTPLAAYTLVNSFATLARVDKQDSLFKVAGLTGAWFFRCNPTGHPVYSGSDGSCSARIDQNQADPEKSLSGAACANLSLMELYRTHGFDYLGYVQNKVHTYQILDSEEGRPVNTDFEVAEKEYSHGGKGKVVIIRRRNTFWHKFKVDEEDDYFLLMSFQRQLFYSSAVAVNVRVDGGPILFVPLGGATGEPYMIMQRVMNPVRLMEGLHTVGVRYRGLLFTKPAIIDCTVLQPVLERRWFSNSTGKKLMLINNTENTAKNMLLDKSIRKHEFLAETINLDGKSQDKPFYFHKKKQYLKLPASGFGIIEW